MIQIENTIVNFDVFRKKFCCDLAQCKGVCCIEGDSGDATGRKESLCG